jgi:hypothetical protein
MTSQLSSGNGVFPPRHRRDDSSDIKASKVRPGRVRSGPVSHWWPALLGTRPAAIKQKSPEAGMEHTLRVLLAARHSASEADHQDTCIAPQRVAMSAVSGDGVMTGASCS